jgi:hypothetical protein
MRITISVNVLIQALAGVLHFANMANWIVPAKYKFWIAGVIMICQGLTGILAHYSNPNGTPAEIPYIKK